MAMHKLDSKIMFGRHRGSTIKEIIADDPSYLEWALDEIDEFRLDDIALAALEKTLGYDDPLKDIF